jgi:ribulose-5-phosphate 4-epimerase/fuculose-1-phosphate aldolase
MERLIDRYAHKIVEQKLALPGDIVMGDLDAELTWNRDDTRCRELARVFDGLNISSLAFITPAQPYRTIIDYLCSQEDTIVPRDNEIRTFLHDIPVIREFDAGAIVRELRRRKSVIVQNHGVVSYGTVSPEQTFIVYSSVLFSTFVKFFSDYLLHVRRGIVTAGERAAFENAVAALEPFPEVNVPLARAPFSTSEQVYAAVAEAGRPIVQYGFVDSVMGNISYHHKGILYISQTGSFLDELEEHIDPCPLDNSMCTGITASSELPAHIRIVTETGNRAVMHGHPKFSVIMSMVCDRDDCPQRGQCHIKCPEKRSVGDIPIVPGETGTGPRALCNTVPDALDSHRGVIVFGHGVFTKGKEDFNEAIETLWNIERMCREEYFNRLASHTN